MLRIIDPHGNGVSVRISEGMKMGRTRMFFRAPVFEFLERLYLRTLIFIVRSIQTRWRASRLACKKIKQMDGGATPSARNMKVRSRRSSMVVAMIHFSDHPRRNAMRCIDAAIRIQRRSKVYREVRRRKLAVRGFTRLQAVYRGYKARLRVRKLKHDAAVKLQAMWRKSRCRTQFLRWLASAKLIEHCVRGWLAVLRWAARKRAVRLLQWVWRGTAARIKCSVLRQKLVSVSVRQGYNSVTIVINLVIVIVIAIVIVIRDG